MAGRTGHLVRRFFGSLRPGGPPAPEVAWVRSVLTGGELERWSALSGPDRRHSAQVARRVERALGVEATAPVLAAALLHDVGKTAAGLRTPGRVVATLAAALAGREAAATWRHGRGVVRRVGLYLDHPRLGAEMLALVGSDPLTVAWTAEHHLPEDRWTVPLEVGRVLRDADDD